MQAKLILSARLFSPAHYVKSWRIYSFTMFSVLIREIFFLMVHFWLIICLYNLGLLAGQKRPENNLWLWWSGHYFNINIQITGNSYNFSQHFSKAALQNQVSYCVPPAMAIWLPQQLMGSSGYSSSLCGHWWWEKSSRKLIGDLFS